ncbi:MAG: DegT/DnrJ/EryC1/StrS family aminotransferase, partial [Anaerolineaceae bacterium]|nr:DegT/DnrJ/EryC1/StrS family aminotransferase [Anaerolineaceae bacterium]
MTQKANIPMSSPDLTELERQAVLEVFSTNYLSMGKKIVEFEEAFRAYTGCQYAIGVSSGTSGLHLCVRAAGIRAGDLVLTTPFSFVASTNVILYENAVPVFVDVQPETGNIDPALARQAASDLAQGGSSSRRWLPRRGAGAGASLKALLPIDVFGQPCDLDGMRAIANEHHIPWIEDACEALGSEYRGAKAGTQGDMAVYAFYPNKQITTGEGGMIVTNDEQRALLMQALRNQGRAPGDTWLQHTHMGYNYRLNEFNAALGVVQMSRLEELLHHREQVAGWYDRHLQGIAGVTRPLIQPETTRMSWFVFIIWLEDEKTRDRVAHELEKRSIPVRPYFTPIHLQPYMVERFGYQKGDFPVTESLGERGLALPFSGKMSEEMVAEVCRQLRE